MNEENEMTKERLKQYRSNKEEIREKRYRLEHLGEGDNMIGNDTIFDYRTGFPRAQPVVGVDWEKLERTQTRYEKQIAKLEVECLCIELWIEAIPDSITRRIFEMSFIDGMKQKEIAHAVSIDRSCISRKIDDYLKFAHKTQKTHL